MEHHHLITSRYDDDDVLLFRFSSTSNYCYCYFVNVMRAIASH